MPKSSVVAVSLYTLCVFVTLLRADYEVILNHKDVANGYFSPDLKTTGLENADNPEANTYSIIGNFDDVKRAEYQNDDGAFKLKLQFKYGDGTTDLLEWTQTSWITESTITGFSLIQAIGTDGQDYDLLQDVDPQRFRGLGFNGGSLGGNSAYSYLDGNGADNGEIFQSVGEMISYGGGIPGMFSALLDGKGCAQSETLWISAPAVFDNWIDSFKQCQYGYAFSQPEPQCPGFRIRFMDSASRQCYLSFGEQCTTCAGARTYAYESEDELNMFWDCESKGAKWKLSGANKDSMVALHSQYTAQANSIVSATNEHDLKGDLVVSGANDWTSFNFGEASKIRMSANTGCGVTAASELVEFAANARYTHGYNFTQGYEARVSCVSSVLLQMPSVEFVYEGIPEPTPGVLTQVNVTELPGAQTGNGSLRLQEALTYMHPYHTLECSIQLANLTNGSVEVDVLPGSYVVISNEMYEASIHIELGGILLASTNVMESELPRDCLKHPAFKIVGIEMLDGGVKLEVQEAAFFEYITEFEGTFANLPFLEEVYEVEPEEEIVNEQEMIDQDIENATITLYEYYCVDYDEDEFEIPNSTFIPADGVCGNFTVADEEAGQFGDNGFLPTVRRRRTWGWAKRIWKKVKKVVVKVVKKVVKTVVKVVGAIVTFVEDLIAIFSGDLNKRLFHREFSFGSRTRSVSYSADQAGDVYAGVGDHVAVSHFELDAGLYFRATAYADLCAKFGWFKFERFTFTVSASAELDAWFEMEITGGAAIEHEVYEKKKTGVMVIVVIPIVYTLHGEFAIGIGVDISIGISAKLSFPETHIRFGVEYKDGSGWKTIEEMPDFQLTKSFGAEMLDSDDCVRFIVTPYIQVNFGVKLYEAFDIWIRPRANFPTTLVWPATCNAGSACDQGTKQLGFQTTFDLDFMYGVTAQISIDGHKIGPSWTAFRVEHLVDIVLFDQQCIPMPLPFIDQVCCPPTSSPTKAPTTTKSPTYDVTVAGAESLQQCGTAWTEHTEHRGMRPDCPVTTGGVFGSNGYQWGNIDYVKAACEQEPSCNVIMAYDWLIGSIDPSQDVSSYSYSCPDVDNIDWITETNTWMVDWHLGEAVILDRFRWTEHMAHMGMRPDCPAAVGGVYSHPDDPGFMWATAPMAQAACEAHATCNVVVHYDAEIGSVETTQKDANYAYSCPDVKNIIWEKESSWSTELMNSEHYELGEPIVLERCGRRQEQYAEGTLEPVDCTIRTSYSEAGSANGLITFVSCEAGETLTSCGVDGWKSVGGSWIDRWYPNSCMVLAHGPDRAYPKAVCCKFPAGAITATEVRGWFSAYSQKSLSCQFGQVLTGCQIMWQKGAVNNLAGTWTGAYALAGTWTGDWEGIDDPYCAGAPKTSDTFVKIGAQCLSVADGYSMQCTHVKIYSQDGFGECPETHPLMTSCNAYTTDSNTLDSWFVNSGRCYVAQDNWAPMYATAICCRFASVPLNAAQRVPEARDFGDRQVEPNEPQPQLQSQPQPRSYPDEPKPQPQQPQPYSAPNEPQPQANQPQAQPQPQLQSQPQPRSYPDEPQAQPQPQQPQAQAQLQSQPQLRSYPNEPQAYSQPKSNPNEPQPDSQPLPNPVRNIPVDSPQAPPLDVTPYFNMNIALIALSALISIGNIIWSCKVCASKKAAAGFSKLNDDDDDDQEEEERSSSP